MFNQYESVNIKAALPEIQTRIGMFHFDAANRDVGSLAPLSGNETFSMGQ